MYSINNSTTYLGILDELRAAAGGPKAFLRPVLKLESEKPGWEAIESGEFPNRGLASWWKPPANVLNGSAWLFRVHESDTFERENQYHNLYNVWEHADPATELVDAAEIQTEEDLRSELYFTGMAVRAPLTARVVIRFAGDRLLGPVHVVLRDGRIYLPDEALNPYLAVGRAGAADALAKYDGHRFLPPDEWLRKIGEVDFSPDSVFLKRVLKEIRLKDLASMKLTDGLVRQLVAGAADTGLTVLERQRLERLKSWTAKVEENVALSEEVVGEILELPAVRKEVTSALDRAKADARLAIEQELTGELQKIEAARVGLAKLGEDRDKLLAEIAESRQRQEVFVNSLEDTIEARVRSVMERPQEFLAENALMRAALSFGEKNPTEKVGTSVQYPSHVDNLITDHDELIEQLNDLFSRRGFREYLPLALHAAFLAGNIPLLYGTYAREALTLYSNIVSRGNIVWVPISPSYVELLDLFVGRMAGPQPGVVSPNGLLDLLKKAQSSNAIYIVVCEGVNRCFIQSAIEPLFRHVVNRRQGLQTGALITLNQDSHHLQSAVAIDWPPNVLLAGTIVEERSLYSVDVGIWDVANWIFTDPYYDAERRDFDAIFDSPSSVGADADAWKKWESRPEKFPGGDLKVFLKLVSDKLLLDSSFYSTSVRLYSILNRLNLRLEPRDILLHITEMILLPRCTKQLSPLKEFLEDPPFEIWQEIRGVEILQRLSAANISDTPTAETW